MDSVEVFDDILGVLYKDNDTVENLNRLLLEKQIDINWLWSDKLRNYTLLLRAIFYYPSTIPTLLKCGANPIQKLGNTWYETPFHAAVIGGWGNMICLFMEYCPELPDGILDTAIHKSSVGIIETLMDAGAKDFSEYPPGGVGPCNMMKHQKYIHAKEYALVIQSRITRCKEAIYGVYLLKDAYNKDILFMVSRLVWKERKNKVWI